MTDELRDPSASLTLQACAVSRPADPSWLAEAIVLLRAGWARWLLVALVECVRVPRGRAGHYEVIDYTLVLIAYAVSGARTLEQFYREAGPVTDKLMAVWQRGAWPSRSALSRFLADVPASATEQFRTLF